MKYISDIMTQLLAIAKDTRTWLKILILVIAGFGGAILFSRTKVRVEDCTFCQQQKNDLIQALIKIKTIESTTLTNLEPTSRAVYWENDTTPKQKLLLRYIDSVIGKIKQDSISKSKN